MVKIGSSINRKEFKNDLTYKSKKKNITFIKIKEFGDIMKTSFYYNKVLRATKEKTPYKCLALARLESILNVKRDVYYSQTYLEECKYCAKDINRSMHIIDVLEKSLSDESANLPEEEVDSGNEYGESEEPVKKSEEPSNESENNESENNDNNESKKPSKKSKNSF